MPKISATIIRYKSGDQGTRGQLITPDGFSCALLELPWRGNRQNISRIPAGEYRVTWHHSPRFGGCYWIRNVPGRSGVLIHPGNVAGDVSKYWRTHSWGCIILGRYWGRLGGQQAVMVSRPTVRAFSEAMGRRDFTLKILEVR